MISRTLPSQTGAVTLTTMVLPAHWASVLINGDKACELPPEEHAAMQQLRAYGQCIECADEFFSRHHDVLADGILPGMCSTFTFVEVIPAHIC